MKRLTLSLFGVMLLAACSNPTPAPTPADHSFQGVWSGQYQPIECGGVFVKAVCDSLMLPLPPPARPLTVTVNHSNATASGTVTIEGFSLTTSGTVSSGLMVLGSAGPVTFNGRTASLDSLTATIDGSTISGTVRFVLDAASLVGSFKNVTRQ